MTSYDVTLDTLLARVLEYQEGFFSFSSVSLEFPAKVRAGCRLTVRLAALPGSGRCIDPPRPHLCPLGERERERWGGDGLGSSAKFNLLIARRGGIRVRVSHCAGHDSGRWPTDVAWSGLFNVHHG